LARSGGKKYINVIVNAIIEILFGGKKYGLL